jgi:hypothetical protein
MLIQVVLAFPPAYLVQQEALLQLLATLDAQRVVLDIILLLLEIQHVLLALLGLLQHQLVAPLQVLAHFVIWDILL